MMFTLLAILCIIILAPLAMGSVYIVTYSLMGAIVFAALGCQAARFALSPNPYAFGDWTLIKDKRFLAMITPFVLFLLVCFLQLIPLPSTILHFVSPDTSQLYEKLGLNAAGYGLPLSISPALTTAALLKWCTYGGLFLLLATWRPNVGSAGDQRWLLLPVCAIFAVGCIESVYGLYNAVNHSDSLFWFTRTHNVGIVSGTYINPDHLAGLLDMAIPVSVGLFLYQGGLLRERYGRSTRGIISLLGSRKALWLWVLSLGVLVMVLAHIFTLSRMGHISVMAALGIVFVLYGTKKLRLPVVVMIILLSLGILWAMWEGMGAVIAKWGMFENSFQGRHEVWKGAFSLAANFPLFGTGLGTFRLAYPPYKASGFGATTYDHAHNDYVEMFAETGMIGSIPWIAFFCLFLFLVTRSWFRNDSFFAGTIGTGCIAAVIAALVHSLADFNLQIPANAAVLFIILGITWRMTEMPHPARASSNKPTGRL